MDTALALQTITQNSNTKGLMLGQVKLIGIWSSYNQKGQDTGQWWYTGLAEADESLGKASLVYRERSRTVSVTQRNPIWGMSHPPPKKGGQE